MAAHVADALRRAAEAGDLASRYAVVRERASPLGRLLSASGLVIVEATDAERGLAFSLRAGLAQVRTGGAAGPAALLVALADQPDTDAATIAALVERWRATGADAVRPRYSGEPEVPGPPVLVDRRLWPEIERLEGDAGLGAWLRAGGVTVASVTVPGRNPDIDTRADLAARDRSQETPQCD